MMDAVVWGFMQDLTFMAPVQVWLAAARGAFRNTTKLQGPTRIKFQLNLIP